MIFHFLYRLGHYLALRLPLKVCYAAAAFIAALHYALCRGEKRAVMENLKIALGMGEGAKLRSLSKEVFKNFAKYLVDFLRSSKVDIDYIKKNIKLEGLSNIEEALKGGKGAILLSAHIGNWELGGLVLGILGYKMNAVVLTHQNKKINEFFINQRARGKFKSIEFGASLRGCYKVLKNNELLALLGDRDFSKSGIKTEFFGKLALMPKGPSVLSYRTGAPIVPGFMFRNSDDTYTFIFEKAIQPHAGQGDEDSIIREIMKSYLSILEKYIRRYPGQWYVFKELWRCDDKDMCPDTII